MLILKRGTVGDPLTTCKLHKAPALGVKKPFCGAGRPFGPVRESAAWAGQLKTIRSLGLTKDLVNGQFSPETKNTVGLFFQYR